VAREAPTIRVVWLRRGVQTAVLLLFFYLFLGTVEQPTNQPGAGVRLFFQLDPLAALASGLAAHAIAAGMLLSLGHARRHDGVRPLVLRLDLPVRHAAPLFFQPAPRPASRTGSKPATRAGTRRSYYALAAFLGGALLGANVVGWLDPLAFFFRSLATAVYPP